MTKQQLEGLIQRKSTAGATASAGRILLQRKCACGGTLGPSGECEECRKKRQGTLQRATLDQGAGNAAPSIVQDVLRSPGQPLDTQTRAFMESRFGHDFSQVRIHSDARAVDSAQEVHALAYTVGRDVVFGAGQYAPATSEGRKLIAHELTHTIQQSSARGESAVPHITNPGDAAEQEAERASLLVSEGGVFHQVMAQTPGLARKAGGDTCDYDAIASAAKLAVPALNKAQGQILDYLKEDTDKKKKERTRAALESNFRGVDQKTALAVWTRLGLIKTQIGPWTRATSDKKPEGGIAVSCADKDDPKCATAIGLGGRSSNAVAVCPSFFLSGTGERVKTIIHEFAHALPSPDIIDIAYAGDRAYRVMSAEEALVNADSYAELTWQLNTGQPAVKPMHDTSEDCPWDWRWPIHRAIARAEQWNRFAFDFSTDTPDSIPAAMKELGIREDADRVYQVFKYARQVLLKPLEFQCEESCDKDDAVYWDPVFGGDLHVCPGWMNEFYRNAENSYETMLAGLYGYLVSVDSDSIRNHARIARKLAEWEKLGYMVTTKRQKTEKNP